jgi:hypothetical protein
MTLERLLQYTNSKGWGYPEGNAWAKIDIEIRRKTGGSNWSLPKLRNPLILGGSMASPHQKEKRFVTQIYWTYKNSGYETMVRLILNLQDKEWRGYDAENLSRDFSGFSIQDIEKEYASWQGVYFYHPVFNNISRSIRKVENLDLSNIDDVDHFLLDTRKVYELNHGDFSPLYEKVLKYAIQKAVIDSNESLTETIILALKDKVKDYPEFLEYALIASRGNHQLKKVMYNLLRDDITEVRDYKGDGGSFFGPGFPTLCD